MPPPRKNQVLYHGVLASRAAWRQQIVPQPRRKPRSDHAHTRAIIRPERASQSSRWMLWSTLLKRVFEVNGFECPLCGPCAYKRWVGGDSCVWGLIWGCLE